MCSSNNRKPQSSLIDSAADFLLAHPGQGMAALYGALLVFFMFFVLLGYLTR